MVEHKTRSASELHVEKIKDVIDRAKAGDLEPAFSADAIAALSSLKSKPDTYGLYLGLVIDLERSNKSIRRQDIDAALRSLSQDTDKIEITLADQLIELVTGSCTLFFDQEDQAYAAIEKEGHREVWSLHSQTFKDWVSMLFYRAVGTTPRASTISDAFSTLAGIALHDGDRHHVYLRVAADGSGGYYLDIGDELWRVIHITDRGWKILDKSPVMFRRSKASKAIPIPEAGGQLSDLKALVNVDCKDDLLLLTALIDGLRPDTAYPVIELIGEEGSGKSTTAENIRRLIDPHSVNLRNAPRSVEDAFVGARNNHVVCLNNLSRLSGDLQDAICNLSTGGGYASRKLYTNDDEVAYEAKRQVVLNGINTVATQQDLISRLVRLECPIFDARRSRLDEKELRGLFDKHGSRAIGFILDTMVEALAKLPDIELLEKQRLLDFSKLGAAVGRVMDCKNGELTFLARLKASREAASFQALESTPVVLALVEYLENHGAFAGNYADLLREIESKIGRSFDAGWPRGPRGLSESMGRAKSSLRQLGWNYTVAGRGKNGVKVSITQISEATDIV